MAELTRPARGRIEDYLDDVREQLRPYRSVDADEVVRDVREHVDAALAEKTSPVSEADASEVLDRLGPPDAWLPDGERSPWQSFLVRMRRGPEDWRLAYMSLASFSAGIVLLGLSIPPAIGLALALIGYVSGRAVVDLTRDVSRHDAAQRWLVYPAVGIVQIALLAVVLLWPLALAIPFGATGGWLESLGRAGASGIPPTGSLEAWSLTLSATGLLSGIW